MIVRTATAADVPVLHALVERAYRGDTARVGWTHEADLLEGQRTDADALTAMLADPAQMILLALGEDGEPIGSVALDDRGDGRWYLGMLTVTPDRQAAGLGRQLLAAAEEWVHGRGARVIEMTVIVQRPELIAWYERRSYAQTGERRPFPLDDPRFGVPKTRALEFVVLAKAL